MATNLKQVLAATIILAATIAVVSCSSPYHDRVPASSPPAARPPLPVCPEQPVEYKCRKLAGGEVGATSRGGKMEE